MIVYFLAGFWKDYEMCVIDSNRLAIYQAARDQSAPLALQLLHLRAVICAQVSFVQNFFVDPMEEESLSSGLALSLCPCFFCACADLVPSTAPKCGGKYLR